MIVLGMAWRISHLRVLEAESIDNSRKAAAELQRLVMFCSAGKDSSVILGRKQMVLNPAPILINKFREMIEFRDASLGLTGSFILIRAGMIK